MKLILIFYHVEYDEDLMEILEKAGIRGYSKIERILGKGKGSQPRWDTAVWPGFNNLLMIGIEQEGVREAFLEELKKYSDRRHGRGICAFVLPGMRVI